MMKNKLIATGKVMSLCINGVPANSIHFYMGGPFGDVHSGTERKISGHDGAYMKTSQLKKDDTVFNWRSWTGLSYEEVTEIESTLGLSIPKGCLLENMVLSGIPNFSKLKPTTRLVFHSDDKLRSIKLRRPILAVWEENSPCHVVGKRLEDHHKKPGLKTDFVAAAKNKRGVMGMVLSTGIIEVGDKVLVYPPAE